MVLHLIASLTELRVANVALGHCYKHYCDESLRREFITAIVGFNFLRFVLYCLHSSVCCIYGMCFFLIILNDELVCKEKHQHYFLVVRILICPYQLAELSCCTPGLIFVFSSLRIYACSLSVIFMMLTISVKH